MRIVLATLALVLPLAAEESLRPLLEQLRSESPSKREEARTLLAARGTGDIPAIRAFAESEKDEEARQAALGIADEIECRDRVPEVLEFCRGESIESRLAWCERTGPRSLLVLADLIA